MTPLSQEYQALRAFLRWLEILEENGKRVPGTFGQLRADIDHSALLPRLLAGVEPSVEPPPRSMSYPNYGLLERGWDEPMEVYEYGAGKLSDEPCLVIDQTVWHLVEKLGESEWLAAYWIPDREKLFAMGGRQDGVDLPETLASTRWRVSCVGTRIYPQFYPDKFPDMPWGIDQANPKCMDRLWRIERVEQSTSALESTTSA